MPRMRFGRRQRRLLGTCTSRPGCLPPAGAPGRAQSSPGAVSSRESPRRQGRRATVTPRFSRPALLPVGTVPHTPGPRTPPSQGHPPLSCRWGRGGRVPEAVHPSDAPSGRTFAESLGSKATASPARCPAPPGAAGRPRTRGAEPRGGHVGPQEPHLVPTWSPPPRLLPAGVWGETRARWAGREQLPPPPGRER